MTREGGEGDSVFDGGGHGTAEGDQITVSGELLWKARAEQAEEEVERLAGRVSDLESELSRTSAEIEAGERRRGIERELVGLGSIDLDVCCLLVETVLAEMDEPDVSVAVRDVRERKPHLFEAETVRPAAGATMAPVVCGPDDGLRGMAERARSSGERAALLRYMRCRRG